MALTEGGELLSSPKKKARTVCIAVDGCNPTEMQAAVEPNKGTSLC